MRLLFLLVFLLIAGCSYNVDEALDALTKCEELLKEPCSLVAVPNSGAPEIQEAYKIWMTNE